MCMRQGHLTFETKKKLSQGTMYIKPHEVALMKFSLYRVKKNLLVYIPPVFLLLGTIGNVLSMIILTRRRMRKYSAYLYLAVLSGADLVVLHVGLLRLWIGELTGFDLRNHNDWSCKVLMLVGYAFSDYSGWLICAVTFERWVAVCHAFKMNSFGKKKRTLITIVILFVVLLIINSHFIWTVQLKERAVNKGSVNMKSCEAGPHYRQFIAVWPFVDACIYSFLPFVLILVLNTLIIRQVIKARKELLKLQQTNSTQLVFRLRERQIPLRVGQMLRARESRKITLMLLTISFTFLLTTLPINLALIATKFLSSSDDNMPQLITFNFVMTVTELLMYCNHSLNFFLYCATGAKFRNQLLCLFRLQRRSSTSLLGVQELQSVDRKYCRKLIPHRIPLKDYCSSSSSRRSGGEELFAGRKNLRPSSSSSRREDQSHSFPVRNGTSHYIRDEHSFPFTRNGGNKGYHREEISLPLRNGHTPCYSDNYSACNGSCGSCRGPDSDIIVGIDGHTTRRLRFSIGAPQGTAL